MNNEHQKLDDGKKPQNFIKITGKNQVLMSLQELFDKNRKETRCQCLMILDNQMNMKLLQILQPKCQMIILVDGGSSRVFKSSLKDSSKIKCIIGDFDGAQKQVLEYYSSRGVHIIKDQNQDTTDFQKCLEYCKKNQIKDIICMNFFPGRIDHVFAAISNTQKLLKNHPQSHMILIGVNSMMVYLHQKVNYVLNANSEQIQKSGCGLITFGKVDHIETEGFKWNMGQKYDFKGMEWGNFLSTSNQIIEQKLKIRSSEGLFFICQMKKWL